jgi:hypothetical protein
MAAELGQLQAHLNEVTASSKASSTTSEIYTKVCCLLRPVPLLLPVCVTLYC